MGPPAERPRGLLRWGGAGGEPEGGRDAATTSCAAASIPTLGPLGQGLPGSPSTRIGGSRRQVPHPVLASRRRLRLAYRKASTRRSTTGKATPRTSAPTRTTATTTTDRRWRLGEVVPSSESSSRSYPSACTRSSWHDGGFAPGRGPFLDPFEPDTDRRLGGDRRLGARDNDTDRIAEERSRHPVPAAEVRGPVPAGRAVHGRSARAPTAENDEQLGRPQDLGAGWTVTGRDWNERMRLLILRVGSSASSMRDTRSRRAPSTAAPSRRARPMPTQACSP